MTQTDEVRGREQEKYEKVHAASKAYKQANQGRKCIEEFSQLARPVGLVLDCGAGNGLATGWLKNRGYPAVAIDIARNAGCHALEATQDESIVHCLWNEFPIKCDWIFCTDVMEHLPPEHVEGALHEMAQAGRRGAYFQICTVPDVTGPKLLGEHLHLTVEDEEWWERALGRHWPHVRRLGNAHSQVTFFCTW